MAHSLDRDPDSNRSRSGSRMRKAPAASGPFAGLRLLVVPAPDRPDNDLLMLRAIAWTRM